MTPSRKPQLWRHFGLLVAVLGVLAGFACSTPSTGTSATIIGARAFPPVVGRTPRRVMSAHAVPSGGFSPQQIRTAYGVDTLINAGFTGKGQTIAIIDSFGSPTIAADLHQFDQDYGLSDPPALTVLAPLGSKPFDPGNNDMVGWAFETTLDVEWAHAMAPDASLVLLTSPVSETEGVHGMPQFLKLEKYVLNKHLATIISQSWGATENTLFTAAGRRVLADFERFYKKAAAEGVTVLASSGDSGSANPNVRNQTYPFPTVSYPASSPYVTAVGGTSLSAPGGVYQSETVWNNGGGATGGGISRYFKEPSYQSSLSSDVQSQLKQHRGLPDIAWNADPSTPILVYLSFLPGQAGYYTIGGTSEGAPQWAGIIADANQKAGKPLGFLNPKLYALGLGSSASSVFNDITVGNNAFDGISGYSATAGFDLATGWGSPKAAALVDALITQP